MALHLGFNRYARPLWLTEAESRRAMYILGVSRSGKSNLIKRVALDAFAQGEGVAVLDVKDGMLARQLAAASPNPKLTHLISPGDCFIDGRRSYIGLNPLYRDPKHPIPYQEEYIFANVLDLFEHLGELKTDFTRVRQNLTRATKLALTLPDPTLIDIRFILTDRSYYERLLKNDGVESEVRDDFDRLSRIAGTERTLWNEVETTVPRVKDLINSEFYNYTFGQYETTLPLRDWLDHGHLIIFDLATGLPPHFAPQLGSVVTSILLQLAQARDPLTVKTKKHWRFCLDEFHLMTPFGLRSLLDTLGSRQVWPVLAHQNRSQLAIGSEGELRMMDAVTGIPINAYFQISSEDRRWFKENHNDATLAELDKMKPYHAYLEARHCPAGRGLPGVGKIELVAEEMDTPQVAALLADQQEYATPERKVVRQHQERYYGKDAPTKQKTEAPPAPETANGQGKAAGKNRAGDRGASIPRRNILSGERGPGGTGL